MIQIKDIAKACNVSPATVSKALNDQSDVSEETKKRIRYTAQEMGYIINSAARALKAGKTNNIGVIFRDMSNSGLAHEYFSTLLDAIRNAAQDADYDITFINNGRNMTPLQHCQSRGIDGVIIACTNFHDPQIEDLINSDIPVVTVDFDFGKKISVMSDNEHGGRSIIEYAYEMGHRNFGLIHGELTDVTKKRLKGIMGFCEEKGLVIPACNIKQVNYHDTSNTFIATQELLRMSNRPTCIFFQDDVSYIGGMNAIYESGLNIPEDISAIGYDGIALSRVLNPRLVTYHQDTDAIGRAAVDAIVAQIDDPENEHRKIIDIHGYLFGGGSVKLISES